MFDPEEKKVTAMLPSLDDALQEPAETSGPGYDEWMLCVYCGQSTQKRKRKRQRRRRVNFLRLRRQR